MKSKKKEINYWEPHARILSAMPRFNKAILDAREKLGIPADGLPGEKRAEWYQNFFGVEDGEIEKRYGLHLGGGLIPNTKKLLDIIDAIREDFNLDTRWVSYIMMHLGSNDGHLKPPSAQSAWVEPHFNDVRLSKDQLRVTSLAIRIEKDASIKDIQAIWKDVERYQAYMDGKIPSRRDLIKKETVDRYCQVIKLRADGLKYQEIAREFPNNFTSAEDVRSFKNKIEARFKKRTSLRNLPNLWWHE